MDNMTLFYDSFLFLIVILKIIYIVISFFDFESKELKWKRVNIIFLDKIQNGVYNVENFLIYFLLIILFSPFTKKPISISRRESHLLLAYGILGLMQIIRIIWLYYKNN